MEETNSELTKISLLTKRVLLKFDKTNEISSRTDKSVTEITDLTDLSMSKLFRTNINNENINNAGELDETIIPKHETEKSGITVVVTYDNEVSTITSTKDENLADEELSKEEVQTGDETTYQNEEKNEENITSVDIDNTPSVNQEIDTTMNDEKILEFTENILTPDETNVDTDQKYDKSKILPLYNNVSDIASNLPIDEIEDNFEEFQNSRRIILTNIRDAMHERKKFTNNNDRLQTKLVEYFRRKRPDVAIKMQKLLQQQDSAIVDIDQRYTKYLKTVMILQEELKSIETEKMRITQMKNDDGFDKESMIKTKDDELTAYRQEIAMNAANSHTGRKITLNEWESMINSERKKSEIVQKSRLENIKLQYKVNKLQAAVISKEHVGNKLSLMDFEQIKIENQAFYEKLEERKDVIRRLKLKIHNNIHILTHMKEKLRFYISELQKSNETEKHEITVVNISRRALTKLKKSRDEIISNNRKLISNGGLLNHETLLKHFEKTVDQSVEQRIRLEKFDEIISTSKKLPKNSNNNRNKVPIDF